MTIEVTDVNDNAPSFDLSDYAFTNGEDIGVDEVLGTVRATDPEGDPLSYSILTNNNGLFEIGASNGEISLADGQSLDFDTTNQHLIILAVSDGMFSNTAAVTIWVTNVNDNAPSFDLPSYAFTNGENIGDDVVLGTVRATDPEGDPLSYSILTNDNDLFEIGASNGEISLADGQYLDFDTTNQHLIILAVSDGTFSNTTLVTIWVTNVNDNVPVFSTNAYTWTVAEDISDTNTIGLVAAGDPDGDLNPLSYFILTNDNGLFEIGAR